MKQRHHECDTVVLCGFDIGECKNDFVNKYSNIITNNITCHDLNDGHLFSTKKVSKAQENFFFAFIYSLGPNQHIYAKKI